MAGTAPHWGRREGVFVAVAEVEPDGVRLDNGMRLKNQERPPGRATQLPTPAARGSPSTTASAYAAPPVRRRLTGHELRVQHEVAHLKEHAPLPAHQPHVPGLHKRAGPATRELRGARRGCRRQARKRPSSPAGRPPNE